VVEQLLDSRGLSSAELAAYGLQNCVLSSKFFRPNSVHTSRHHGLLGKLDQAVALVSCNREVLGSNFGVGTGCSDWDICVFLQANFAVITEVGRQPRASTAILSREKPR
jgi:hypothetical protein